MNEEGDGVGDGPRDESQPPWWHVEPGQPPADSLFVEGLKLAVVLRDWAVESGAAAAVAGMAATAATNASAVLNEMQAADAESAEEAHAQRCSDCPVCRALNALDKTNPGLADTARMTMAQAGGILAGLLAAAQSDSDDEEQDY